MRGCTLQQLIVPNAVVFLASNWEEIGTGQLLAGKVRFESIVAMYPTFAPCDLDNSNSILTCMKESELN